MLLETGRTRYHLLAPVVQCFQLTMLYPGILINMAKSNSAFNCYPFITEVCTDVCIEPNLQLVSEGQKLIILVFLKSFFCRYSNARYYAVGTQETKGSLW